MKDLRAEMKSQNEEKNLLEKAKDYAYEYIDTVKDRRAFPSEKALENLSIFRENMPTETGNAANILEMLHKYGSPATVSSTAGRYFGFVNGSFIPVSMAARWLADVWDQNSAMPTSSPIVAELEEVCEKWLADLIGLPEGTGAGFVSGSSIASLCGLAAGRNELLRRKDWIFAEKGLNGAPRIKVIVGKESHATVLKGLSILGFGKNDICEVPVDAQGRMIPEEMPHIDSLSLIVLQAGNVTSGAFDPFKLICEKASKKGAWVHIDGAFGLWAAASRNRKHLTEGIELADSWSLDGHKTLNTPYDSGIVLCKDRAALASAMHASGSYLLFDDKRNGMMFTPEMSRRARAVELWAVLKYLGKSGIASMVDDMCDKAVLLSEGLKAEGFDVLNDVVFNQVVSCGKTPDDTKRILAKLSEDGTVWCGGSAWHNKAVIRISVCSWETDEKDIRQSIAAFAKARDN